MKYFSLLSFSLLMIPLCPARPWTNQAGKTIEANFVRLEGENVVLSIKEKEYSVPIRSLSDEDQSYLKRETGRLDAEKKENTDKFMGQKLILGKLHEFDWELSEANRKIASEKPNGWKNKYASSYPVQWLKDLAKTHKTEKIRVLLGIPTNFNPSRGCPIFVQWTTSDIKSNIDGGKTYWDTCNKKGWMLVSIDAAPDSTEMWANAVFLAGIKEFFEQLHLKYPGSQEWKVATGGFSGGSKICQWMGALMHDLEGVSVTGYWLGGCNEVFFDYAMEDLNIKKNAYRKAKVYISSGNNDQLVSSENRKKVEDGCKKARFRDVHAEVYEGGHSINYEQFAEALDLFL